MRYLLFNPENDLALAQGESHYNPPAPILSFASDLDLLPLWYADDDEVVLTNRSIPSDWMMHVRKSLGVNNRWMTMEEYWRTSHSADSLRPWGWNYSLYHSWCTKGKSEQSIDTLHIRRLSSRENVIPLLNDPAIRSTLPNEFQMPEKLSSLSDVRHFVLSHPKAVLKSPWSSSGKGLCWTQGEWTTVQERWTESLLKKQGFVMGEHAYEKEEDFAIEFCSVDGCIRFVGYSLFVTENGKYKCNRLESDERLEQHLTQYVPQESFRYLQQRLVAYFTQTVAPHYQGYFGVDMMVCRLSEGGFFVHPCVEINLRMNMGVVAHHIYERHVAPASVGEYYVKSFPASADLRAFCEEMESAYPVEIREGRVCSGFLPLTFYDHESMTLAYIFVRKMC